MRTDRTPLVAVLLIVNGACSQSDTNEPNLDPDETIAEFCQALFACPGTESVAEYGTPEGCEGVHRNDYDDRDEPCQRLVLELEECRSSLTCYELERVEGCHDEIAALGNAGCRGL